jgi:hypothetical protein
MRSGHTTADSRCISYPKAQTLSYHGSAAHHLLMHHALCCIFAPNAKACLHTASDLCTPLTTAHQRSYEATCHQAAAIAC